MTDLKSWLARLLAGEFSQYIPFLSLAFGQEGEHSPMITRLIEAAIIAAVSTGGSLYITVQVLSSQFESLSGQVEKLDDKVERYHRDTTEDIRSMRRDLYIPRGTKNEFQSGL